MIKFSKIFHIFLENQTVFTVNEIKTKFKEIDKIRPKAYKTRQAGLNNPLLTPNKNY